MREDAGLVVRKLVARHGQSTVVNEVSLSVAPGQLTALLGPSGCGKTTLLRAVAGLHHPDAGEIRLDGIDLVSKRPQDRRIGMLFQHFALFPNLTTSENIGYGLVGPHWPSGRRTERIRQMLELVGLASLAARLPAELSGGQRQRVALARALAPEPKALLMDEPFSALDESLRGELRQAVREILRATGQACLMVTHDRQEAWEMADHVVVMGAGRVLQSGTPQTLMDSPTTLQVARFLGSFNEYPADWHDALNLVESLHAGDSNGTAASSTTGSGGMWVAPVHTLTVNPSIRSCTITDTNKAFSARVEAVTLSEHGFKISLKTQDGIRLAALIRSRDFVVGQEVHCLQPLANLRQLPPP